MSILKKLKQTNLKKKLKQIAFKRRIGCSRRSWLARSKRKGSKAVFSQKHVPGSYSAAHTYSVVSAVYNVEKYLDDFFTSMTTQTINLDNLTLIMVDDGFTDSSATVIKKWAENFPELIVYIRKENGGQASARNLGLNHVKTDWVTFIDPDDYVSKQYFEKVDRNIEARPDLCFATCRFIFNYEARANIPTPTPFAMNSKMPFPSTTSQMTSCP